MLIIFICIFVIASIFVPYFFTWVNMVGLVLSVSMIGMVATTMLFTLASGAFDLSVGSTVAFTGVLTAIIINSTGNIFFGIISGLIAGILVGYTNGYIIAKGHINALIATLATQQIVRGLSLIVSKGSAVGIYKPKFFILGTGSFLGVPIPVWVTIFCFIFFAFLLTKTSYGSKTLAIGGNEKAARLIGINVEKIKINIFTIQGLVAGAAGIILAARMASGQPNTAHGFELDVMAACVLGGVSLSGGKGTMVGVLTGVLIIGTVENIMNLLNIRTFYQYLVSGLMLLLAVFLDEMKQRKK